ncbi:uncharacterized protein LOC117553182 [Gymnodraco acuticeps]|uniref:Uncharacterized protein LOC117553182 n=1 Tax=Gymnodraco acuticeps TaxID=8218 RepID=A0A6P8V0F3_GYMAC|nr:uncharacterized protein LOC117553182 [Gymnodraco acuticeps]
MEKLAAILLCSALIGNSLEDAITAISAEVCSSEGRSVTLSCTYSVQADNLQWYRQDPGSAPQFLLLITDTTIYLSIYFLLHYVASVESLNVKFSCRLTDMSNSHFAALGSMNSIKPERSEEHVAEGRNISLTCKYEGAIYNIQWYRQYQRSRPEFLLHITEAGGIHPTESDFSAHIDKTEKRVDLEIISAKETDSAVYYCAVRPTRQSGMQRVETASQLFCFTGSSGEGVARVSCEDLTALQREEFSPEESSVSLSYRYSKQATVVDSFFWYRQYPGKPPEFIISHLGTGNIMNNLIPGLKIKVQSNQINMSLSSAAVTDSAVFYCAVRPTVTGNTNTLYKNTS